MDLSPAHEQRLRLLSDDSSDRASLYRQACDFVTDVMTDEDGGLPDTAQLTALQVFAQQFSELQAFVEHQERRFRDEVKRRTFYDRLKPKLGELRKQAADEFVAPDLPHKQRRDLTEYYASLVGREFVRHMIADAQLRRPRRASGARR